MVKIAPSMLSADFLHLEKDIVLVNQNADLMHLDIMDGTLVPNISYGFPVIEAMAKRTTIPMDAHLMIINPHKYFETCARLGVKMISFHLEALCGDDKSCREGERGLTEQRMPEQGVKNYLAGVEGKSPVGVGERVLSGAEEKVKENLFSIKNLGLKAGLAINPDISVECLYPYIGIADYFLIMSVFAGFGGQSFIKESLNRVRQLKNELVARDSSALIEVDGGVGTRNSGALLQAGADILVAGSSIFKAFEPAAVITKLRQSEAWSKYGRAK